MLLTAYRAAGLLVNMLKDNIEMDSIEMALSFARSENNLKKCLRLNSLLSSKIFGTNDEYLDHLIQFCKNTLRGIALLIFSYAKLTTHRRA